MWNLFIVQAYADGDKAPHAAEGPCGPLWNAILEAHFLPAGCKLITHITRKLYWLAAGVNFSICSQNPIRLAANGRRRAGSEAGGVWNGLASRVLQTGRAITAWIITHWRGDTTRPADQQSSCEVIIKQ